MSKEEIIEPVLNNGEPYWLTKKYDDIAPCPIENNTPVEELVKDTTSIEPVPVFELKNEGLWICRKCGAEIQYIDGKPTYCTQCDRNSDFSPSTETITGDIENLWKLPKWHDIPIESIDMLDVFDTQMDLSKQCLIFPEGILYKIFNLWIISTYHIEIWDSVGFLSFLGIHDSGKTRALDFISELAYRMIHGGSGISFPAMCRGTHFYNAGILFDQAETHLNSNTPESRQKKAFVLPSYRRRSKYVVAHQEDQKKTIAYKNYGFKAFASERAFDPALTSRCIPFQMERDYPEIAKLSYIQDDLDILQNKLLNYKFKFKAPDDIETLLDNFELKGRIREIFESIITTGTHIGVDVSDVTKYAINMEKEKEEELQGTIEYEILKVIKGEEENETLFDAPEEINFTDLCNGLGWETDGKTKQRVGYILTKNLLLKTKRKSHGTVLLLNEPKNSRRLKYLYRRYNV